MDDNAIVLSGSSALMPAMDMSQAQIAYQAMVDFVKGIMKEGTDFGTIPGTPKPTLYKPGAEKLTRFFGLAARFDITKEIEQWEGEEPFFYYRYKCSLSRLSDSVLIAEGEGSCNSHEKKYRYRNADRTCPNCGKTAIIKGKKEFGGGWLCYGKKGGCGAKFPDNHFSGDIAQVINPDVADLVNTIQKMAQKRALIAATLIACNASEYFTQDVEDLDFGVRVVTAQDETGEIVESTAITQAEPENGNGGQPDKPQGKKQGKRPMLPGDLELFICSQLDQESPTCEVEQAKKLAIVWKNILQQDDETRLMVASFLLDCPVGSFKELTISEADVLKRWLTKDPPSARLEAQAIIDMLADQSMQVQAETALSEQEQLFANDGNAIAAIQGA
jgi:hypothetical protein